VLRIWGRYVLFWGRYVLFWQFSFVAFGCVPYGHTSPPILRNIITYRLDICFGCIFYCEKRLFSC